MTALSQNRKALVFVAASLAFAAALVSIALACPQTVSDPLLGDEWQCSRTVFLTSCTRIDRNAPVVDSLRAKPIVFRRA